MIIKSIKIIKSHSIINNFEQDTIFQLSIDLQSCQLKCLQWEIERMFGNPNLFPEEKQRRIDERDKRYKEMVVNQYEKLMELTAP